MAATGSKAHSKLRRSFLIAVCIQAVLLVMALGLSMVAKSQTSKARGFDMATSRLNADFENVGNALNRLYRELSAPAPSQLYIESLQQTTQAKLLLLRESLAWFSDDNRYHEGSVAAFLDDDSRRLVHEITPRINSFIARTEAFAQSDFQTLQERFSMPSVTDLVAARNGMVLRSLDRLVEHSRKHQQRTIELFDTGIKTAILLLFLSLWGSWYWIVRPAIAKQKLAIQREIDFSADLGRKNAELQLAESRAQVLYEEAARGLRARTEFLGVISHELRTPLNAIMGFSEIMKEEVLGKHEVASYRDYSGDIYRSGEHLLGIISDILQFTQFESGRSTLENAVLSLDEIFGDVGTLTGKNAAKKGIELVFRNDMPEDSALRVDRRLVGQALINLIDNAIKFSETDSKVVIHGRLADDGGALICVRDEGIGIDPMLASSLFEPFEQIESAFSRNSGGIGLGLAITRKIMVAHDGGATVESSERGGSSFSLYLPGSRVLTCATVPARDDGVGQGDERQGGACRDDSCPNDAQGAEQQTGMMA